AKQRSGLNFTNVLRHPLLLFWHSEPHPDEIGAGFVYGLHIRSVFLLCGGGGGRGPGSNKNQGWEALGGAAHQSLDDARASSVEKVPMATLWCSCTHRQEQI